VRGCAIAAQQPSIFFSYNHDDDDPFDLAPSFVARLHRDLTARGFEVWFDRTAMPSRAPDVSSGNSGRGRRARAVGAGRRGKSRCVKLRTVAGSGDPRRAQISLRADKAVTPILRRGDYPLVPDELKLFHSGRLNEPSTAACRIITAPDRFQTLRALRTISSAGEVSSVERSLCPHYCALRM